MNTVKGEALTLTERCNQVRDQLRQGCMPPSYVLDKWIGQTYAQMVSAMDEGDQLQYVGHKIELLTLKTVRWSMPTYEWVDL